MQVIPAMAIGRGWNGVQQRYNPSLLFDHPPVSDNDPPVNGRGSILPAVNSEAGILAELVNSRPSFGSADDFRDTAIVPMLNSYLGPDDSIFTDTIIQKAPSYEPQFRKGIGSNSTGCEPQITSTTSNVTMAPGGSAVVAVNLAAGTQVSSFQWYRGTSGDTSAPIAEGQYRYVTVTAAGSYWVAIKNKCGTTNSSTVIVTVAPPCAPASVTDPDSVTINQGDSTTLHTTAENASTYQWYIGRGPLAPGMDGDRSQPIPGANAADLFVQPSATTMYWVLVSNGCSSALSATATVTVNGATCTLPSVVSNPTSQTISSGSNGTLSAAFSGTAPVSIAWFTSTGAPAGTGSSISVIPTATTTYFARATNACGTIDSASATITVGTGSQCTPPSIATQPQDVSAAAGDSAQLSLGASGTAPLTVTWYTSSGTTVGTGTSVNVSPQQTSSYYGVVTNACGSVQSRNVTVTLVSACVPIQITSQPPTERIIVVGQQAAFLAVGVTGTSPRFQWFLHDRTGAPDTAVAGATLSSYVAAHPGDYFCRITNDCSSVDSSISTVLAGVSCVPAGILAVSDDVMIPAGASATLEVAAGGGAPYTYAWKQISDDGVGTVIGTDSQVIVTPTADVTHYQATVSGLCGSSTSHIVTVTLCHPPAITAQPIAPPLFTAVGQSALMTVTATGSNLSYQWFHGGLAEGDDAPTAYVVAAHWTQSFMVRISNDCGTVDSVTVVVPPICNPPTITQQPQSALVRPGETVHLSVTAHGNRADNSDVSYQWYQGNSSDKTHPLSGQTAAGVNVIATSTPASYWVDVKGTCNTAGDVTTFSQAAVVSACSNPVVDQITPEAHIANGQQASITVAATGTALTYQWYEGTTGDVSKPIAGATQRWLTPSPAVNTNYWARIYSQGVCSIDTATIPVYVCNPPAITTQPASLTIQTGTSTTLTITTDIPTGVAAHYQWYRGETGDTSVPVGTDSSSLNTGALTDDTAFWVHVTKDVCTADSATAHVTACSLAASIDSSVNIAIGQSARLMSYVSNIRLDAQMMYKWYRGAVGDRSNLVSGGPSSQGMDVGVTTTTSYWLEVSDGTCTAISNAGTVNVCIPTITTQPTSVISSGNAIALNVAANTSGLTYQWYEGSAGDRTHPVAAPAGTAATLTFTPTYTANYWVRVTGTCSRYADSNVVTVTRCAPPAITTQPSPRVVTRGTSTSVSVTATGTNLTYQWYQGNAGVTTSPIANATSASLTVTPTYTTNYWVRIGGYCGSIDSSTVQVSVTPIITVQPVDVLVTKGAGASLSVTVDANPVVYQWYRGAANDTSNPICTNSATCTTPAVFSDTQYWVRVTSGLSSVDSNVVTAHVCQAPTVSVTQPANQQSNANILLTVVNPDMSHTYAWYNGVSGDTSSLIGSGVGSYVISQHPTQTANYWVRDIGPACSADSATINVPICTPAITTQPSSVNVNQGQQVTLTVAATGTPTLTYQWYTGTSGNTASPVSGATTASLTFTASSTQTYWVRVTNGVNGAACYINSNAATVTVCIPPSISTHPSNPIINRGQSATIGVTASGSNLQYQWYQGAKGVTTTAVGSNSNILTVTPQTTTSYWVRVSGCSQTADSNAGTVSVYPIINTQPANTRITKNTAATFSISVDASPVLYQWYAGVSPDTTTLINGATNATYTTPALAADANYWVKVTSGSATVYSNTATATICTSSVVNVTNNQVSGANATLSIATPNAGETYSWYQGTTGTTTTPVLLNTTATSINVQPTQSTYYWVRTFSATCSSDSASALVPICYPKVNTPTGNLGITSGQQTTLTVSATGTPNLTYQWYQGNSGNTTLPVSGGTQASVTVQPGSTASYWVRVTSSTAQGCYADSAAVTVTVCQLPVITTQPQPMPYPTSTYSRYINVVATGSGLQYHWYEGLKGVTTTPVGTNASQIAITPGVTKYYWVRVSNACGSVDSEAALQSVAPTVSVSPDPTICSGSTAALSVSASGTMLSYQWYQTTAGTTNDTSHPVGTPNSTTFTTPALTQTAVYWCRVTSGNNWTNSTNITVTVSPGPTIGISYSPSSASCGYFFASVDGNLGDFYYAWYVGNLGDTSHQVSGSYYASVCAVNGRNYWLRVTDPTTGCHTDAATAIP